MSLSYLEHRFLSSSAVYLPTQLSPSHCASSQWRRHPLNDLRPSPHRQNRSAALLSKISSSEVHSNASLPQSKSLWRCENHVFPSAQSSTMPMRGSINLPVAQSLSAPRSKENKSNEKFGARSPLALLGTPLVSLHRPGSQRIGPT